MAASLDREWQAGRFADLHSDPTSQRPGTDIGGYQYPVIIVVGYGGLAPPLHW